MMGRQNGDPFAAFIKTMINADRGKGKDINRDRQWSWQAAIKQCRVTGKYQGRRQRITGNKQSKQQQVSSPQENAQKWSPRQIKTLQWVWVWVCVCVCVRLNSVSAMWCDVVQVHAQSVPGLVRDPLPHIQEAKGCDTVYKMERIWYIPVSTFAYQLLP